MCPLLLINVYGCPTAPQSILAKYASVLFALILARKKSIMAKSTPPSINPKEFSELTMQSNSGKF